MSKRVLNFSAGPATLPVSVLEKAQNEFLNWNGTGMSIMEMSHRSKEYLPVIEHAKASIRSLLKVPENYDILFLQGGASLQFSMVPINLAIPGKSVDVVNTGSWTKKAIKEIKRVSEVSIVGTSEAENFSHIPEMNTLKFNPDASFAYIASNNTIAGTQWMTFPDTGNVPLVADMSSDILSRPLDVSKFGLIFAGAQKNIGPSGVTLVIIRRDLMDRCPDTVHSMLQYRIHSENDSMYNTPNTFGIYLIGLVCDWLSDLGGLKAIEKINQRKADKLYDYIYNSAFYKSPVRPYSRSLMNVVFRIKNGDEDLEKQFVSESTKQGMIGLKGHRLVGGLRASIYNAFPEEGVDALIRFMDEFATKYA